jgi:hypothetical protein
MMPLWLHRKTRIMEKVENLYRTARVQKAMPRHHDQMVETYNRSVSSFRDVGHWRSGFRIIAGGFEINSKLISVQSADKSLGPDMSHFGAEFFHILRRPALYPRKI